MELVRFIYLTAMTTATWSALYGLLCRFQAHRSSEWNSRVVSMVHAIVSLMLTSVFGFFYNPWPFTDPGGEINEYETFAITVSNGYFVFEFLRGSLVAGGHNAAMAVHHVVCILFGSASLLAGVSGTEICFSLLLAELTNPMLQGRWFLRSCGRAGSPLYEANQLLFLVLFVAIRLGVGSYWLYTYLPDRRPHPFFKVGATLLYLVGWVFMAQILGVVHRRIRRGGAGGSNGDGDGSKGRGIKTPIK